MSRILGRSGDPECDALAARVSAAAVPDPQDEWGCRCWPYSTPPPAGHKHFANGCDRHPERRPGAWPAVPDPRPTVCLCDGRPGPHGYGDSGCLDAVPDHRFRDQIAEALYLPGSRWYRPEDRQQIADALLSGPLAPLLAKLRAVEELAEAWENRARVYAAADDRDKVTELRQRATALRRALDPS